jgi:uncharacterized protein
MLYLKRHETDRGDILALCDKEHIGKVYKDKKSGIVLDLEKYADFYKGELMDYKQAQEEVNPNEIYSANVVGEESVKLMLEAGIAVAGEIKEVSGVPFVHIYKIF